jgi:hypothetical protein
MKNFQLFLQFLVIKTLDPDWNRIRIRIHLKCWIRVRIRIRIQLILIHSLPLG